MHCYTLRTGNSRPDKLSSVLGFLIYETQNPFGIIDNTRIVIYVEIRMELGAAVSVVPCFG